MLWYLEEFISISKMLRRYRWFALPCQAAGSGMGRDGLPKSHLRASLWRPFGFGGAPCGTVGASVCAPLVTSGAKAPKRYENCDKMDVCLGDLSADEQSDVLCCSVFFQNP